MKKVFLIFQIFLLPIFSIESVAQSTDKCDSSSIVLQINSFDSISLSCELTVKFPIVSTDIDSLNVIISNTLNEISLSSLSLTNEYLNTHSFSENNMNMISISLSNLLLPENVTLNILHFSIGEIICDTRKHYSNLLAD